jgi:Zn-dependent membrane protease YugP
MTKLMISLTDALTGKNIVREMNAEELANHAIMQAEVIAEEEALTARKIAKAAAQTKLAALGLTTDDLKALGL